MWYDIMLIAVQLTTIALLYALNQRRKAERAYYMYHCKLMQNLLTLTYWQGYENRNRPENSSTHTSFIDKVQDFAKTRF